jgi:Fe-S-cluster containining protein
MSGNESPSPWYRDGLEFGCTRCGHCCTGAPGYVWVSRDEIRQIAEFRGEDVREFSSKFVRRVHNRYSLIEKPNGDCIFWDKQAGCTVYSARPVQCRTWPFWPENVESREAWDQVCRVCPGSGMGRIYSVEEIVTELAKVEK